MYMSTTSPEQTRTAMPVNQAPVMTDGHQGLGIMRPAYPRWHRQYGSLDADGLEELRQLRNEVRRLKRTIADLNADKRTLCEAISRLW